MFLYGRLQLGCFAWPPAMGTACPHQPAGATRERPLSRQGGEGRVGHVGHITRLHHQATSPQARARPSPTEKSAKADIQKTSPRPAHARARFWGTLLHRMPVRSPPFTSIHQPRQRQRPLTHLASTWRPPRAQTPRSRSAKSTIHERAGKIQTRYYVQYSVFNI